MRSFSEQLTNDLDVFINTDDFAETVTLLQSGSPQAQINIIWDDNYEIIDTQTGQILSSSPAATCKSSDVSSVALRDIIIRGGINWRVIKIVPDGNFTVLILSKR